MLQAPIAELDVAPGQVVEWRLRSTRTRAADPTPTPGPAAPTAAPASVPAPVPAQRRKIASYNQEKHFTTAQDGRTAGDPISSYVAASFEIDGPLDRPALDAALHHFVRRHEVLRCEFRQLAGDLTCEPLGPDEVTLEPFDLGHVDCPEKIRTYLSESFERIDTLSWPLFVMGAVIRDTSTTVYLAFDHLVSDGMSTPIAVHDIATAYEACSRDRAAEFPETGSYLTFGQEQRLLGRSIDADDSRLGYWKTFMAHNGGFFPPFPLDLGVEPGRMYPTLNETDALLSAAAVDALEARCLAAGGRPYMGVLAAVAVALRKEGGPDVYRGLMPVSERGRGSYAHAMGWFVNTLPIEFSVAGDDFTEVIGRVRAASTEMLSNIGVPFVKVWHLLAPEYASLRSWPYAVNFFSYLDFRKAPGAEHHTALKARKHIWASSTNGICFWFHRNDTGLYVNSLYVETPQARHTKAAFVRTLSATMTTMADTGEF
ncbi:condensation domain-containing protein [Streptomyces sp. NPDC091292]|uniref:condensation domain-containing protein n=1 Tax=Streptomyces sp. NPDC091292 TaxID=3365991 RepID=UPI0037FB0212